MPTNCTVGSKIIRAFEIIRAKKLIPKTVFEINICQLIVFRIYTVYNKHETIKIDNQSREQLQILSQMLE